MNEIHSNISVLGARESTAVLTIDNGAKNLLTEPEFIECNTLVKWLEDNPEVTSLIITGAGRHFSHGADVSLFESDNVADIGQRLENARRLLRTIEQLPIVTAAAINGGCFGGGLEIALSCQFRICSPKSFLGLTEIMRGVIPGMGGMERLTRLVGRQRAISMCLRGEMLSAKQALASGIITEIADAADCLEYTLNYVRELTADKTRLQINSIIETINAEINGVPDPSKGYFERVLEDSFGIKL